MAAAMPGPGDSSKEVSGHACSTASTPSGNVQVSRWLSRIGRGRPCGLTRPCAFHDVSGVTEPNEASGTSGSQGEWLPAPVTLDPPASTTGGRESVYSTSHPGWDPVWTPPPALGGQAGRPPGSWPLRDFIELGSLPTSVPCARYHARQIVWEWRLTPLSETVELVVDELVTNAVSASRSLDWPSPVRVWLLSDRARVLVLVWALSTRWDWYAGPDAGGKLVYALIAA